jgi:hypothetical protein
MAMVRPAFACGALPTPGLQHIFSWAHGACFIARCSRLHFEASMS